MRRTKFSAALYLLLVFLSGALVGGSAYRLYMMNSVSAKSTTKNPEEWRRKYVTEMRSRLKLTDDQLNQLDHILDDTRQRFRELDERTKPQLKVIKDQQKAIQNQHVQKVRAMLTESQQAEYEKMRAEREKRRHEAEKSHHSL